MDKQTAPLLVPPSTSHVSLRSPTQLFSYADLRVPALGPLFLNWSCVSAGLCPRDAEGLFPKMPMCGQQARSHSLSLCRASGESRGASGITAGSPGSGAPRVWEDPGASLGARGGGRGSSGSDGRCERDRYLSVGRTVAVLRC